MFSSVAQIALFHSLEIEDPTGNPGSIHAGSMCDGLLVRENSHANLSGPDHFTSMPEPGKRSWTQCNMACI